MLLRTSLLLLLTASVHAQADTLLVVERGADRAGRDRLYALLHKTRVDVALEEATPQDLAKFLAVATNNATNFVVRTKDGIEPITIELERARLTTVMDFARRHTDLRFVFKKGLVALEHTDKVREFTSLRRYDVRAATTPIPSYPGPKLGLTPPDAEVEVTEDEVDENNTASGLTPEKLVDVIRTQVDPDSWDGEGVSVTHLRGVLWVRQTDSGHRKTEKLLRSLGVIEAPKLVVPKRARIRTTADAKAKRK